MISVPAIEDLPVPLAGRYSPAIIEWALRQEGRTTPFPSADDRSAWAAIGAAMGARRSELLKTAMDACDESIAPLPATLYLDFERSGRRRPYEQYVDRRRARLRNLVLAQCLTVDERLHDPILDLVWAICEESDWCRPAHHPQLGDLRRPFLDLTAAMTALQLAETDHLLGDLLHPAARRRLREEIDRRCFTPYLERHDFHWMFTTPEHGVNNWAAVIAAGVVGAGCYLEADDSRLAELVARGLRSLDDYRAGFDEDGGTSEGSFCWAYGFGYYTILADLLEQRTGGLISLWDERSREIALFPLKTFIAPDRFVNFSDCPIHFTHIPAQLAYLAKRLGVPELMSVAAWQPPNERERQLSWALRALFWAPSNEAETAFVPARHDDFQGLQWLLARQDPGDPDALVLAAKGGHNAEMHNQNDIGNFTVDAFGEPLLVDLGKGGFNRAYFQHSGGRYDFLVNASRGHSVPVVNGFEQPYGRRYAARELERTHDEAGDHLLLELKDAYPRESGLASLRRSLYLDRQRGVVELTDAVRFAAGPGSFESALITLAPVSVGAGEVMVRGERGDLVIEPRAGASHMAPDLGPDLAPDLGPEMGADIDIDIDVEEIEGIELEGVLVTIRRITFRPTAPVEKLGLRLIITPRPRPLGANPGSAGPGLEARQK